MFKKNKKLKVLLLGVVVIAVGLYTFGKFSQGETKEIAQFVDVHTVEEGPIEARIRTKGNVEATSSYVVQSEVTAQIKTIFVTAGDKVEAGDPILEFDAEDLDKRIRDAQLQLSVAELNYKNAMDTTTIDAALRNAKLNYENAKKSLEDTTALHAAGIVSTKEKEASQFAYDQAYNAYVDAQNKGVDGEKVQALQLESARNTYNDLLDQKEKYVIRANAKGTLTELNLKPYDMVTAGAVLGKIEDLDNLIVKTYIAEYDISKISVGMPVQISGYSTGNEIFSGAVQKIASTAGVQTTQSSERSVLVTIEITDKTPFMPNFTADLSILYAKADNALKVPYETLLQDGDEYFVLKVNEGIIEKVPVKLGIQSDIEVEVVSNQLVVGNPIITNPTLDLTDGLAVEIQEETN